MIVGIFSDVHSNNYALNELLSREQNVNFWICAGDIVGLFPNVNETLNLIREHNILSVFGDHEYYLLNNGTMAHSFSGNDSIIKQRLAITKVNLNFVSQLNKKETCILEQKLFCVTHTLLYSNPDFSDSEKYSFDWPKIEKEYEKYDIVISGHNHLPLIYYGRQTIFINPGSIGFPIGKWALPSYCILDTSDFSCTIKYLKIDFSNMKEDIKMHNYNKGYISYLTNNFIWQCT